MQTLNKLQKISTSYTKVDEYIKVKLETY